MNLIDEYAAPAQLASVRARAEAGYRRRSRRARRIHAESRHRLAPPSG